MAEFVRICAASELPQAGGVKEFNVDGRSLCVTNVGGTVCVLDGTCPHEGGPLAEGTIEDGLVVCPWHGYAFDPRTGASDNDPELKATVFQSKVEGGALQAVIE